MTTAQRTTASIEMGGVDMSEPVYVKLSMTDDPFSKDPREMFFEIMPHDDETNDIDLLYHHHPTTTNTTSDCFLSSLAQGLRAIPRYESVTARELSIKLDLFMRHQQVPPCYLSLPSTTTSHDDNNNGSSSIMTGDHDPKQQQEEHPLRPYYFSLLTFCLDAITKGDRTGLYHDRNNNHNNNVSGVGRWDHWVSTYSQRRRHGLFEACFFSLVYSVDIILAFNGPHGLDPTEFHKCSEILNVVCREKFLEHMSNDGIFLQDSVMKKEVYLYNHCRQSSPFRPNQLDQNNVFSHLRRVWDVQGSYAVYGRTGLRYLLSLPLTYKRDLGTIPDNNNDKNHQNDKKTVESKKKKKSTDDSSLLTIQVNGQTIPTRLMEVRYENSTKVYDRDDVLFGLSFSPRTKRLQDLLKEHIMNHQDMDNDNNGQLETQCAIINKPPPPRRAAVAASDDNDHDNVVMDKLISLVQQKMQLANVMNNRKTKKFFIQEHCKVQNGKRSIEGVRFKHIACPRIGHAWIRQAVGDATILLQAAARGDEHAVQQQLQRGFSGKDSSHFLLQTSDIVTGNGFAELSGCFQQGRERYVEFVNDVHDVNVRARDMFSEQNDRYFQIKQSRHSLWLQLFGGRKMIDQLNHNRSYTRKAKKKRGTDVAADAGRVRIPTPTTSSSALHVGIPSPISLSLAGAKVTTPTTSNRTLNQRSAKAKARKPIMEEDGLEVLEESAVLHEDGESSTFDLNLTPVDDIFPTSLHLNGKQNGDHLNNGSHDNNNGRHSPFASFQQQQGRPTNDDVGLLNFGDESMLSNGRKRQVEAVARMPQQQNDLVGSIDATMDNVIGRSSKRKKLNLEVVADFFLEDDWVPILNSILFLDGENVIDENLFQNRVHLHRLVTEQFLLPHGNGYFILNDDVRGLHKRMRGNDRFSPESTIRFFVSRLRHVSNPSDFDMIMLAHIEVLSNTIENERVHFLDKAGALAELYLETAKVYGFLSGIPSPNAGRYQAKCRHYTALEVLARNEKDRVQVGRSECTSIDEDQTMADFYSSMM